MRKVVVKAKPVVPRDYAKALYGESAKAAQKAPEKKPADPFYGTK